MEITASGRSLGEEELRELISLLQDVNQLARSFAKTGVDLRRWLREEWSTRQALPAFRVLADGKDQFFCSEDEYREFLATETQRLGREPRIGEEESLASESENGKRDDLFVYEIHGAESGTRQLQEIEALGFSVAALYPEPRVDTGPVIPEFDFS